MSVNFIDHPGKSRLRIDEPAEQIDGTVIYRSKLTTPLKLDSYLGLFDNDDETSMFYFQRGYEPEINYLLEIAEPLTRSVLIELGFYSHSVITESNGNRVKASSQKIPSLKRWNNFYELLDVDLNLGEVDSSKFSNDIAEELYFEDGIIPVSNKEPWRFHDLSVHPIGHILISGMLSQELLQAAYQSNSEYMSCINTFPSLWYNLDNISEELGYLYINGKLADLPNRILGFIKTIGRSIHKFDFEEYNRNFENPAFIRSMETEINTKANQLNSIVK